MFVQLICKARRIEKRRLELFKEKQDSYTESLRQDIKQSRRKGTCRHLWIDLQRRIKKCLTFPKHSCPYRLCFTIKSNGTCENFVAKSIAGFLGGFCLTYIFFMFFVLQLNFTLSAATIMCSIFGSILTLGLAFSYKVRCIVFLVLPQFFSKKGRQALLAYAYILAITGPAKNTLNNMSILGESLACGQEQLKEAVKQILEVVKKPFYAIRDAIKKVVGSVKAIVAKIKEILLSIKRIIMSLVKIVKSAFDFISRMMNVCNKEFGTPYQRCQKVFEDAIVDCNAKLGPMFNWLCNITYLVKNVCYIAKALDLLCAIVDFIKSTVTAIVTKVKQFVRHIRTMFYVRIKFSHSYHFESNHTKSMGDITAGIVTEIKKRSSGLIKIFDFISSAASIFFIFMVVKVIYYRHKFLTNEMFDNKFITKDFRKLDLRRAQLGMETVLPLNHRERKLYISTSSMRLVKKEKSRLSEAAMILLMSTLKLSTHMATDYSLFWIMTKMRYYGRFQSKVDAPNMPGIFIEGEGFLASLLKGIVKAFQPLGINLEIDTIPCLPDPIPPDYDRYIQIGSLLILCWFLAIFESYGLRFRHSVMCFYNPQRARERAIWLYNHILRSRSSFLKFARRQLRRKVKSDKSISKVTCIDFIRSRLAKYPICVFFFGAGKQSYCLLCGEVYREEDKKVFIKCQTPKCPGLYCEQCYSDLQNLCTVCLDPIIYGDMSDISEEKDSSEEEIKQKRKAVKEDKNKRKKRKKKRKKDKHRLFAQRKEYHNDTDQDDDKSRLLSKDYEKGEDSDYNSATTDKTPEWNSDSSTDYETDYQQHKDISRKSEEATSRVENSDVEKQHIPQYASMQDFHTDVMYYLNSMSDNTEMYDTSSNITDLTQASLKHLNQCHNDAKQTWLKYKGMQKQLINSSHPTTSSSYTSTAKSHFTTPESEFDYEPGHTENIPMIRFKSKLSFENDILQSTITSTISSLQTTPTTLDETTATTFVESPKIQETLFLNRQNIPNVSSNKAPKRLEPISEDSKEFKFTEKNSVISKEESQYWDYYDDRKVELFEGQNNLSQKEIVTKTQKGLRNVTTSKEYFESTANNSPAMENEIMPLPINIEPLHYEPSNTSQEVSPLVWNRSITGTSTEIATNSNKSSVSQFSDEATLKPVRAVHPDVPKLDLNFLDKDSNTDKAGTAKKFCTCQLISESSRSTPHTYSLQPETTRTLASTQFTSPTYICNRCRLFKDKIKYQVVDELASSDSCSCSKSFYSTSSQTSSEVMQLFECRKCPSSSSLISSLEKSPKSPHIVKEFSTRIGKEPSFRMSFAGEENLISAGRPNTDCKIQSAPSTLSINTSEISVRKCSLDATTTTYMDMKNAGSATESKEEESQNSKSLTTESPIDYDTNPNMVDDESSTPETVYVLPRLGQKQRFIVQSAERVFEEPTQKALYKERIRNYYQHLNIHHNDVSSSPRASNSPKTPEKARCEMRKKKILNPIRNVFNIFKLRKN